MSSFRLRPSCARRRACSRRPGRGARSGDPRPDGLFAHRARGGVAAARRRARRLGGRGRRGPGDRIRDARAPGATSPAPTATSIRTPGDAGSAPCSSRRSRTRAAAGAARGLRPRPSCSTPAPRICSAPADTTRSGASGRCASSSPRRRCPPGGPPGSRGDFDPADGPRVPRRARRRVRGPLEPRAGVVRGRSRSVPGARGLRPGAVHCRPGRRRDRRRHGVHARAARVWGGCRGSSPHASGEGAGSARLSSRTRSGVSGAPARRSVGLGVDAQSDTGAQRLYERAGMHVHFGAVVFERSLA